MRRYLASIILITGAFLLGACNSPFSSSGKNDIPAIQVMEPWARISGSMSSMTGGEPAGTPTGRDMEHEGHATALATGAAYMKIRNNSSVPDRLLLAQSDVAQSTELHTVEMKDGVMSMHPVDGIEIPAKSEVELKPGGFHIMLIGLTQDLKPGDRFRITLRFAKAGNIDVEVEVRQP